MYDVSFILFAIVTRRTVADDRRGKTAKEDAQHLFRIDTNDEDGE